MKTIAGVLVGHRPDEIVLFNEETGKRRVLSIKGHQVYVRKCKKAAEIEGIALPDKSRDNTTTATVLAIGLDCGKRRKLSSTQKRMRDMVAQVELGVEPLDRIMCPDDHEWGMTKSLYSDKEFFIDECIAIANLGKEQADV